MLMIQVQQAQQAIEARVNARATEDNEQAEADGTAEEECGALADDAQEGDHQVSQASGAEN
jgi:chaperonin cofactor prefoldin